MGSFGLAQIGVIVPEFVDAARWVELGSQRIVEHAQRDFFPDGCHSERCPSSYMMVAYRDIHNVATIAHCDDLTAATQSMLNFFASIVALDGYLAAINDGS